MMRSRVRWIAASLAGRYVRRLSFESADRLMVIATRRGLAHKGNRSWFVAREPEHKSCYLVPVLDVQLRSSDVRCILVVFDCRNRAVWMSLDVSPWKVLGFPKLRTRESVEVIGKLAANSPVIRWGESLTT